MRHRGFQRRQPLAHAERLVDAFAGLVDPFVGARRFVARRFVARRRQPLLPGRLALKQN